MAHAGSAWCPAGRRKSGPGAVPPGPAGPGSVYVDRRAGGAEGGSRGRARPHGFEGCAGMRAGRRTAGPDMNVPPGMHALAGRPARPAAMRAFGASRSARVAPGRAGKR